MANDTGTMNVITQENETTNASKDFTVKADVTALQYSETYYSSE